MPPAWVIIALFVIGLLIPPVVRHFRRRLTHSESKIRGLVREVYGKNIVSEKIVAHGHAKILVTGLKNEPLLQVQVNLTKLAIKHENGASLAALRTIIGLDRGQPPLI